MNVTNEDLQCPKTTQHALRTDSIRVEHVMSFFLNTHRSISTAQEFLSQAVLFEAINLYFQEHPLNNGKQKHGEMKRKKQRGKSILQLCVQIMDIKVLFGVTEKKRWRKANSNSANMSLSHIWLSDHGFTFSAGARKCFCCFLAPTRWISIV